MKKQSKEDLSMFSKEVLIGLIDYMQQTLKYQKERIDKAIEHLHKRNKQNKSALTNKEETIISKHELLKLEIINNKILENILRGNDE